jgi:N-acetylmuramoyl-L-alanine amidase
MARLEETKAVRKRRLKVLAIVAGGIGVVAIVVGTVLAVVGARSRSSAELPDTIASLESTGFEDTLESRAVTEALIEMPSVIGMRLDNARMLLEVAGFVVSSTPTPSGEVTTDTVLAQEPAAGMRVVPGIEVALVYAGDQTIAAMAPQAQRESGPVVCLDPGHQQTANNDTEPLGPGSKETKAKVTGGAVGAVTRQPEYKLTLAVAMLVKDRLEARGVNVVMTRTADAVDISNRQRAEVANSAGADLFVRIHADSNTNAALKGVSILYPSGNEWVEPIEARSLRAAEAMRGAVLHATGAQDRGIVKRADLSGFNWSAVPTVLVEMGFMSNPAEDEMLATDAYRTKLADGIAAGIMAYLEH